MALQTLAMQSEDKQAYASKEQCHLQPWISALLMGARKLTSLSIAADGIPWPPMLGLLSITQLEISMCQTKPWIKTIAADLSFCSCLESLKIADTEIRHHRSSMDLPDLFLQDITTLQSVELVGWYPKGKLTLPPGCLLRMVLLLDTARWERLQRKASLTSMLYLSCMDMLAFPAGLWAMSGLQYLALHCKDMQDQDLAALKHIPHVYLGFESFSTFRLTSGSWQSLHLHGPAGFSIHFSNADTFVRYTKRFHYEGISMTAEGMQGVLQEACRRQDVAYYQCVHRLTCEGLRTEITMTSLSNVKLCRAPGHEKISMLDVQHDNLLHLHDYWPNRAAYPELYKQGQ